LFVSALCPARILGVETATSATPQMIYRPDLFLCLIALLGGSPAMAAQNPWPGPAEPLRIALPAVAPPSTMIEARAYTQDGIADALAYDLGKALNRKPAAVEPDDPTAHLTLGRATDGQGTATGYRSGLTVAMRSDTDILAWDDLAGRKVCFTSTNEEAAKLVATYHATPLPQRAPALSLMKLRTGECDAALHESELLTALFQQQEWQKFSASLPVQAEADLRLSVADPGFTTILRPALDPLTTPAAWDIRKNRWARNVAFEVWLEQDAPDCH